MNNEFADWDADLQRGRLRGFARIRAVLWQRSVRLTEWITFGGKAWFWKLRWRHWHAFRSVNLHNRSRLTDRSLVYGSTPIVTAWKLLELCKTLAPEHSQAFVDLGSGNGLVALTAAGHGYRAVGYELEQDWVRRGNEVAHALTLDCRFVAEDFCQAEWPQEAVVFTVGTAFPAPMREVMLSRFASLKRGSLFVVGDWSLPEPYLLLWRGRLPVDWGIITFSIYILSKQKA